MTFSLGLELGINFRMMVRILFRFRPTVPSKCG